MRGVKGCWGRRCCCDYPHTAKLKPTLGLPRWPVVKNLPANAGGIRHMGLIPGSGISPGGRNGNSLHCSCQENPMDRGAWWATGQVIGLQTAGHTNQTLLLLHPHICTGWGTWWCWLLSCSSRSRWLRPLQWYCVSPVHTPWLLHTVFLNLF